MQRLDQRNKNLFSICMSWIMWNKLIHFSNYLFFHHTGLKQVKRRVMQYLRNNSKKQRTRHDWTNSFQNAELVVIHKIKLNLKKQKAQLFWPTLLSPWHCPMTTKSSVTALTIYTYIPNQLFCECWKMWRLCKRLDFFGYCCLDFIKFFPSAWIHCIYAHSSAGFSNTYNTYKNKSMISK